MRVGVVGHVEWIEFVSVERPPRAGEIVTARETWGEAGGGGGVSVVRLAELAGGAALFTALGEDAFGRAAIAQLQRLGVRCRAAWRATPQRRGFCYVDDAGERTITLLAAKLRPRGDEPLPWDELASFDGIYFTGGDVRAVRAAREARVLVATARELETLREAGVALDALVRSADDRDERYEPGDLDPAPRTVFVTEGEEGGRIEPGGRRWQAARPDAPLADSYGAGDTFAAWLTYALADGRSPEDAAAFAARGSAAQLTRRGAHGGR